MRFHGQDTVIKFGDEFSSDVNSARDRFVAQFAENVGSIGLSMKEFSIAMERAAAAFGPLAAETPREADAPIVRQRRALSFDVDGVRGATR